MQQLNMLVEIKKHKHFLIALALVLLVPFVVYWIMAGHDVAIRNLAAALTLLFTVLIYRPAITTKRHNYKQVNLKGTNSFSRDTTDFTVVIKRDGDSVNYSNGFIKRKETAMDRIKSLLQGENYTP